MDDETAVESVPLRRGPAGLGAWGPLNSSALGAAMSCNWTLIRLSRGDRSAATQGRTTRNVLPRPNSLWNEMGQMLHQGDLANGGGITNILPD